MIKKFVAATTAAVMMTATCTCAFAQDSTGDDGRRHERGPGHRMHHDDFGDPTRMLKMMTRHLDLDDSQSQAIGNILEAAKPQIDALRERGQAARRAVHDLGVDDPDYGTRLQQISMELGSVMSEVTLLHGSLRADVFAQLTPEQRERAAEGRRAMRRHFRHGGFSRGHGPEPESPESE